jgi:hypothetical protein
LADTIKCSGGSRGPRVCWQVVDLCLSQHIRKSSKLVRAAAGCDVTCDRTPLPGTVNPRGVGALDGGSGSLRLPLASDHNLLLSRPGAVLRVGARRLYPTAVNSRGGLPEGDAAALWLPSNAIIRLPQAVGWSQRACTVPSFGQCAPRTTGVRHPAPARRDRRHLPGVSLPDRSNQR